MNNMENLVKTLIAKKLTIASCESLTGGLFASKMVEISGASNVLVGSYVTYMDKAKDILLKGDEILKEHGAISKEMAFLMAKTIKEKLQSNISVSFTGNAGPNANEGKEVGLVYSCIIINEKQYHYKDVYNGNRSEIRNSCIIDATKRILENI